MCYKIQKMWEINYKNSKIIDEDYKFQQQWILNKLHQNEKKKIRKTNFQFASPKSSLQNCSFIVSPSFLNLSTNCYM